MSGAQFDVLGLGAVAIDHLIFVDHYPEPDTKVPVLRSARQCGGLAASALVAAARLGARCAYAGQLGTDGQSQFARAALAAEGIDLTHVAESAEAAPILSVIIVGARPPTRNIFPEHPPHTGAHPVLPDASIIRDSRVLMVDHVGLTGMIRAATIARDAGVALVSDVERDDDPDCGALLALVDHVVMSGEFASQLTGLGDPAAAARALWNASRRAVVLTLGAQGSCYTTDGAAVTHHPALQLAVVDTTGCGDVFHGAYSAMLARGADVAAAVRIATIAAGLKARKAGSQAGAPTWREIEMYQNLSS